MKKTTLIIASLALIGSFSSIGFQVFAAATGETTGQMPRTGQTALSLDYSGLVQCDGVVDSSEPGRKNVCNFAQLMKTIEAIISYMFFITIPVAAVLFAYAGILYMTGKEKNITHAKNIFTTAAVGFIIMLVAWLAVYTLVKWLVNPNSGANTFLETPKQ